MKLYCTVSSERASKGQGGKWLNIIISDSEKKPVFYLYVSEENGEIILKVDEWDQVDKFGTSGYRTTFKAKGKQQKGECGVCNKPWTENVHNNCIPF